MSREDALFRAIRPVAEAMLANRLSHGATVDVNQLTEQVLSEFRQALDIREHEPSLRRRITALVQDLAPRRSG